MPKKKATVKRTVQRIAKQALTQKDALAVLDEVRAEVDAKVGTEGIHDGEVGTIRNGNKVTPTYNYLTKQFPMVTFTPEETIPLVFNGVRVQALAGVEFTRPKCFKDIYDRHRRNSGFSTKKELSSYGINIEEGAGGIV